MKCDSGINMATIVQHFDNLEHGKRITIGISLDWHRKKKVFEKMTLHI